MNVIQYIKLYNYLSTEEKLSGKPLLRTIIRIRRLPKEFKNAIATLMDGLIPDISVRDVSLEQLMDRDGMTPVRAILFLDWLRREPAEAIHYMANDTIRDIRPPLTEEQNNELKSDVERLRKLVEERKRKQIEEQFNTEDEKGQSNIECD